VDHPVTRKKRSAFIPALRRDFFCHKKRKPAMEIAGMCLPLKPQKEKVSHRRNAHANSF
jgi:hypothetical protein